MAFKTFLTSILAVTSQLSSLVQGRPASGRSIAIAKRQSVPTGPWASQLAIGGNGGTPWADCKWLDNGAIIKTVQVWGDSNAVRGIQFTYSDSSMSPLHGDASGDSSSVTLAPGERVTSLTLWGNGDGQYCGRVLMSTSLGQTLDRGKDTSGQTSYPIDIGSGILVGGWGNAGDNLDALGLVFLGGKLDHIEITNVQYETDFDQTNTGFETVEVASPVNFAANTSSPYNWTFSNTLTKTTTTTFTQSTTTTYGVDVTVKVSAELFGVGGEVSTGFHWEKSSTEETSNTKTNTFTLNWIISGTLQPGQTITAIAQAAQGTMSVPYTSTVNLYMQDGSSYSYPEDGVLDNALYSEAWAYTE